MQNTQIPARDATPNGEIKRSNYYPNCSFMTNWIDVKDSITWDVEVAEDGDFEVIIYFTCAEDAIGSQFELTFGDSKVIGEIKKFYDPEEYGEFREKCKYQAFRRSTLVVTRPPKYSEIFPRCFENTSKCFEILRNTQKYRAIHSPVAPLE